jgi:hypothetical protein
MNKNLVEYSITDDKESLNISAKVNLPAFNRVVLIGLSIFSVGFLIWLVWISLTENAPIWFWIFIVGILIGAVYFVKMLIKMSTNNRFWKIILNKNTKRLECPNERYAVAVDKITNVSLSDIKTIFAGLFGGTATGLKITSSDGEKVLMFPIENYERGEEIVKKIKENL